MSEYDHIALLKAHYRIFFGYSLIFKITIEVTMQRKRRKSKNTEDKRACLSPSVFHTPVSGHKQQQPPRFEQWDASEVASFLSGKGFDKYASIFQGRLCRYTYA